MKKLLCALLAAVLTLTLMIPCTATDFAGFSDQQEIENNNAVRMLYDLGLIGPESVEKRKALCKRLELPEHLSANALVEVLNLLMDREELEALFF